jgi:hypothetical protein
MVDITGRYVIVQERSRLSKRWRWKEKHLLPAKRAASLAAEVKSGDGRNR